MRYEWTRYLVGMAVQRAWRCALQRQFVAVAKPAQHRPRSLDAAALDEQCVEEEEAREREPHARRDARR